MYRRDAVHAAGALLLGITAGCADTGEEAASAIELSDIQREWYGDWAFELVGKATNTADRTLRVQLVFEWFDSEDVLLDETFSNVGDIEPGQTRLWDSTLYRVDELGEPDRYEIEKQVN